MVQVYIPYMVRGCCLRVEGLMKATQWEISHVASCHRHQSPLHRPEWVFQGMLENRSQGWLPSLKTNIAPWKSANCSYAPILPRGDAVELSPLPPRNCVLRFVLLSSWFWNSAVMSEPLQCSAILNLENDLFNSGKSKRAMKSLLFLNLCPSENMRFQYGISTAIWLLTQLPSRKCPMPCMSLKAHRIS